MAILNYYLSVTSTATPISPDSSSSSASQPVPDPRQSKILLPKKKPQKWSTGMAPGEYGGPPTTTKLRKYWGGDVDPLESDDFMWNKEFVDRMKKLIQGPDDTSTQVAPAKEVPSGFLSLNRVMSLDSLEVDLSKQLTASPAQPELQQHVEATPQSLKSTAIKWRHAPTRREQDKWARATKAATGGSEVMFREARRSKEDPKVVAEQYRKQYFKLKKRLQVLTLDSWTGQELWLRPVLIWPPIAGRLLGFGKVGKLIEKSRRLLDAMLLVSDITPAICTIEGDQWFEMMDDRGSYFGLL